MISILNSTSTSTFDASRPGPIGSEISDTAAFTTAEFNGASGLSASAVRVTGAIYTGGTGTTATPHWLIQPTGTTAATTWNTAGTAIGVNAASVFTGNLLDFRKGGGSSVFSVSSGGLVTAGTISCQAFSSSGVVSAGTTNSMGWTSSTRMGAGIDGNLYIYSTAASPFSAIHIGSTNSSASPAFKLGFSGTTIALRATNDTIDANLSCANITSTGDVNLSGSTTRSINLRAGNLASVLLFDFPEITSVGAQFRFFRSTNTTGSGSNGIQIFRGDGTSSTQAYIGAYGHTYFNVLAGNFGIGNTTPSEKLHVTGNILASGSIKSNTVRCVPWSLGDLTAAYPAATNAGMKAFITDSTVSHSSMYIGGTAVGGGLHFAPVYSNGTNYVIG